MQEVSKRIGNLSAARQQLLRQRLRQRDASERDGRGRRLVAYVVCDPARADGDELRRHVRDHLPVHMVPSVFVHLDSWPLTPSGKIDYKALPDPEPTQRMPIDSIAAPTSPMETLLAGIWQEVLEVDQVSVHDNFFDLGGHSLLSVQVVKMLEQQTGMRLSPLDLMAQTLGQFATLCEQHEQRESRDVERPTSGGIITRARRLFKRRPPRKRGSA